MGKKVSERLRLRLRRKQRARKKISGTEARPRLSVYRSAKHLYAQVIDDVSGKTLASVGSFQSKGNGPRANKEQCTELGKKMAGICKEKNIEAVIFDKNGFNYHGRVQCFADGAREGGLKF